MCVLCEIMRLGEHVFKVRPREQAHPILLRNVYLHTQPDREKERENKCLQKNRKTLAGQRN